MTSRFHQTNLGSYGSQLPTDRDGYVHLTAAGWVEAGYEPEEAEEMAEHARNATARAEEALGRWQNT